MYLNFNINGNGNMHILFFTNTKEMIYKSLLKVWGLFSKLLYHHSNL